MSGRNVRASLAGSQRSCQRRSPLVGREKVLGGGSLQRRRDGAGVATMGGRRADDRGRAQRDGYASRRPAFWVMARFLCLTARLPESSWTTAGGGVPGGESSIGGAILAIGRAVGAAPSGRLASAVWMPGGVRSILGLGRRRVANGASRQCRSREAPRVGRLGRRLAFYAISSGRLRTYRRRAWRRSPRFRRDRARRRGTRCAS